MRIQRRERLGRGLRIAASSQGPPGQVLEGAKSFNWNEWTEGGVTFWEESCLCKGTEGRKCRLPWAPLGLRPSVQHRMLELASMAWPAFLCSRWSLEPGSECDPLGIPLRTQQ